MTRTSLPNLDSAEWKSVKDYARMLSGYDPDHSVIKGKKTIEIIQTVKDLILVGDNTSAIDMLDVLLKREAYNALIGVEGKNRRRMKVHTA